MCYTGQCKYEHHASGECKLPYNIKVYPEDCLFNSDFEEEDEEEDNFDRKIYNENDKDSYIYLFLNKYKSELFTWKTKILK